MPNNKRVYAPKLVILSPVKLFIYTRLIYNMDNTVKLQHFRAKHSEKLTRDEGGHENRIFSGENGDRISTSGGLGKAKSDR